MKLNPNQLAVLTKAREILTDPGAWTQGAAARDAYGGRTKVRGETATCFCSLGATARAESELGLSLRWAEDRKVDDVLAQAMQTVRQLPVVDRESWATVAEWNDDPGTSHSQVLRAFDLAISRSR